MTEYIDIVVDDIRVKKGAGVPSSLNHAEPAFGDDTTFYLGAGDGTPVPFDCRDTIAATYATKVELAAAIPTTIDGGTC